MKLLLPHRFKKIGAFMAPLGLTLWVTMQLGYLKQLLLYLASASEIHSIGSSLHLINVVAAILGFFTFLFGLYFLTFSQEKVEDEMVQKTRLDSFQFAALVQMVFLIAGFIFMIWDGDPGESGMMLFFILLVSLFWLSFIARFNYILHVRYKQ